jgi:hypothetical protein
MNTIGKGEAESAAASGEEKTEASTAASATKLSSWPP